MAALTPTQARELELTRRGLGSFDDFSKYLESQRTVPVDTGLTAMDGSPLEGRGLDFSAEGISRGLAPARRAIGRGILNPLASLQDLIAVPASTAEALISKGLGGVSSALGATDVGQFFLDQGDKGFDRASSKLSEALGPGQVIKPLDGTLSPADNEQLLDIFGPDPSIGRPKGMVPGKATIKPGTEGLPKKQIPDPSSNVDAAARLMMEQSQTKADANREASLTMPSGTEVSASSVAPSMETMDEMDAASNLFIEALADTKKAKGEKPVKAKTREELLEKYKQEFADATGIDISGKPDTSQALMAMGLSMMQNRAGKKFNVGKILNAVGKAGEDAMPALQKSIENANAAKVAAGKYALNQVEADENAASASRAAHLKHLRAIQLEDLKSQLKAREKVLDAPEIKAPHTQKYTVGATPLEIRVLSLLETNSDTGAKEFVTKFQSPDTQSTEVINRYKNAAAGYGLAEELKAVLGALDESSANNAGQVFELLKGRGQNLISVLGLTNENILYDPSTYDFLISQGQKEMAEQYKANPTTLENKAQVAQDALMARCKRFMTQETGNGISVYDSESAKVLTGKINLLTPLNKNLEYINQLQGLFGHSLDTLDDLVINLYDRDYFMSDKAYEKTIKNLNEGMKDVYGPLRLNSDSNLNKQSYDVRD